VRGATRARVDGFDFGVDAAERTARERIRARRRRRDVGVGVR